MYVGRRRAGLPGLVVAGVAFIAPAAAVVGVLAWAYVRYGTTPALGDVFEGIKPVVLAVVALAVLQLGRTAVKSAALAVIGAGVLGLYVAGVDEPVLLLAAAALAAVVARRPRLMSAPFLLPVLLVGGTAGADAGLVRIAAVFLKVGPCCSAAATSSSPSCTVTWSRAAGSSPRTSCSTPSPSVSSRPDRCSPPPPSSATCWPAGRARWWPRWPSSCPAS
jgi:Chromate transport protein ChrA